jgi:bifunctional DNA-binding transcriptional regulator/antitoxin component of YhaV-PrlF toxin-antitoxin module
MTRMALVKLHHDGWLALPEPLRRKLDLRTGQTLEAEHVDGTIVLRRKEAATAMEVEASRATAAREPPAELATAAVTTPAAALEKEAPAEPTTPKGRGKLAAAALPPTLKPRGRRARG